MSRWQVFPTSGWLATTLLFIMALAVACGAAATATPPAASPTAAAPASGTGAAPTAAPQPTAAPSAVVPTGKVTIMVGDFANERFDAVFLGGGSRGASYGRTVHGFLISDNAKKEMIPGIASQWGLSPDGLTWTFTVRKGVKWHDGSEVTAQDVLWTLQHFFGPQAAEYTTHPTAAVVSRAMNRIELSGPDTISLFTKIPVTDMAVNVSEAGPLWIHMMPKRATLHNIQEEEAYEKNPIGAGPMRRVKQVPGSSMTFERFDDFYFQPKNGFPEDKRVKFKTLDLFLVPEEATRVAAVRAGDADIVPAGLSTRKQVEAGGGRMVFGQEGAYVDVKLYGCWEPQYPCYDKRVRQALDYAINKEIIRDQLYGGSEVFHVKGWSNVTPSTIGYTSALDPWPQDAAKARRLLADAGFPGGKGFGKLIVNTLPSASLPLQVEAAQLAAEFWRRELGLDVEVRVGERAGVAKQEDAGELKGQILWYDNPARIDATSNMSISHADPKSSRRLHEDPELFRLVQETFQIVDPGQRAEASKKLYLRLRDESHRLGIGYANLPWAVGSRVLTWQPYPLSLHASALHTITLK